MISGRSLPENDAARIHAYLHRKEGGSMECGLWYKRAGEKRPNFTLEEEWDELVRKIFT